MAKQSTSAIVLAAGKGTRMRSALPKVLHPVLGLPMVVHVTRTALAARAEGVVVVVGHGAASVEQALRQALPAAPLAFALQAEQRGTGHAFLCGLELAGDAERVFVLSGDVPGLEPATLEALAAAYDNTGGPVAFVSYVASNPTGYGRVKRGDMGAVERIVEHRDASAAERGIAEVNAGIYLISTAFARAVLQSAGTDNAQGEIYLTHVVEAAAAQGTPAVAVQVPESVEVLGVNDRVELAQLDRLLRTTRNEALMRSGVTIRFPDEVQIDADVRVGQDCVIERGVRLSGSTQLGPRCHLEEGAIVTNSVLGEGVHVKPYCVVDGSTLGNDVQVGPFAHLRPGTLLEDAVKIGNFVETKKAHMGRGSKASHLSYLGDCELGKDVNVGAGTITCNYDGVNKHQTVLEDGVFIGSDTQLVAPVRVGRGAYVGAGTTVTEDVPAGALAISRTKQTNVEGWVARKAPRKRQG